MWVLTNDSGTHRVGVVRNLDEDSELFEGVVARLAHAEQLSTPQVSREIVFWDTDVQYFRALSGSDSLGTIPLAAGAVLLELGRIMFRCSEALLVPH